MVKNLTSLTKFIKKQPTVQKNKKQNQHKKDHNQK